MATTYYTLLTLAGQAKVANAVALGQVVDLTHMAIGDGNGNPTTPSEGQTALVREVYRGSITRLTVDQNNANYIIAELAVPSDVGGWTAREIGVFDADGILFCVANFASTYKPQITEGTMRDLVIRVVMEVANSSVVTLKVDPNVVIASRAWVVDNFGLANLIPGGLTNQILTKKSNADGDAEWRDPGEFTYLVNAQTEMQTLADNQVIVDPAVVSTQGLALYVEGAREFDFTVTSPTRITLGRSYPAGTRIWMCQNDALSQITDASVARTGTPPLFPSAESVFDSLQFIETMLKNFNSTEPFGKNLQAYTESGMYLVLDPIAGPSASGVQLYKMVSFIVAGNVTILFGTQLKNGTGLNFPELWVRKFGYDWCKVPSWAGDTLPLTDLIRIQADGKFFAGAEILADAGIKVSKKTLRLADNTTDQTYTPSNPFAIYNWYFLQAARYFDIPRATGTGNSFQVINSDLNNLYPVILRAPNATTWILDGTHVEGSTTHNVTLSRGLLTVTDIGIDTYAIS